MAVPVFSRLEQVAARFDFFIVDLWGVVHDGNQLYPNARETLKALKRQGKRVVFLSNAPRRAERAVQVLDRLGVPRELYDTVYTSGEAVHDFLSTSQSLGNRYFYIGPEKDKDLIADLSLTRVDQPQKANFVLVTGFDEDHETLDDKLHLIEPCLDAGLPMICANPDILVVRQDGTSALCAGLMAEYYEEKQGDVLFFGKPYTRVYEWCIEYFGNPDVSRICAVGDNLDTDILGAKEQGIFSVLVTGGILARPLETMSLDAVCEQEEIAPDAAIPAFIW